MRFRIVFLACIDVVILPLVASFTFWTNDPLSSRQAPTPLVRSSSSRLFGISEWRDQVSSDLHHSIGSHDVVSNRLHQVPLHLMSSQKVALPGEILYLQFTRDDEVRLFQQAVDEHQGIFGLGFISDDVDDDDDILYDKIALVEIQDYNMMGGAFGIFLSVQVVGLGEIVETECHDDNAFSIGSESRIKEQGNKQPLVIHCKEIMNREENIGLLEAIELGRSVEKLISEVCDAEKRLCMPTEDDESRWDRYREAFHLAFEADTQGYTYSATDHSSPEVSDLHCGDSKKNYSWKELNAISWAAFSTSESLQHDATYRLAALDNDCITNRLLLATYWLSDLLLDVLQEAS